MAETYSLIAFDIGDGRERKLKFTGPGIVQIERSLGGRSIIMLISEILGRATVDSLSAFVWGGLYWEDRGLQLETVQEAIFARICAGEPLIIQLQPVIEAMIECGLLTRGKKKEEEKGNGVEDPTKRAMEGSPDSSETGTSESKLN